MKTFKDLVFKTHGIAQGAESLPEPLKSEYMNAKQAVIDFENGYGVSVIIGSCFYSNGIDTYELAIMKNGSICYETPITDDVLGRLSEDEVSEAMRKVQQL